VNLESVLVGLLGLGVVVLVAGALASLVNALTDAAAVAVVALVVLAIAGAAVVGARTAGWGRNPGYW
jgi:hypothetical protein